MTAPETDKKVPPYRAVVLDQTLYAGDDLALRARVTTVGK